MGTGLDWEAVVSLKKAKALGNEVEGQAPESARTFPVVSVAGILCTTSIDRCAYPPERWNGKRPRYPVVSPLGAGRFKRSDIISLDFDLKGLLKDA